MKRVLAIVLLFAGCDKAGETSTKPTETSKLDAAMEDGKPPTAEELQAAANAEEAAKQAAAKKVLAKVKDRDPEEEKRKLAQSKQRSAQARKMLVGGRYTEAVSNARAALKIHEQNVDAMLVLGEVFFKQKKYELTVSVTGTALAVSEKRRTPKETSHAYNLQGFAFASMGQNQRATRAFKKAAEADDKNAAAWNNLGTRYLRAGDVKTAAQCFSYAIELRPGFAKAHLNHGAALRAQRKWLEAEKAFVKALQLKKSYPEAYFNLGVLYLDADPFPKLSTVKRLSKAIQYLNKFKSLTTGTSTEPVPKGVGNKKDLAPMSKTRADDYIRIAEKGLEREDRAAKRERERAAKAAAGGDADDAPAKPKKAGGDVGSDPAPKETPTKPGGGADKPGGSAPQKPGASKPSPPKKPGASKPASPQKPGASKPASPQKPGASKPSSPQKPGASKPSSPQKPGAKKPSSPQKPGAAKPSAPQKPGASKPSSPQKPGASKPSAPQKPAQPKPKQPAPSKPGVQKPGVQKPGVQSPGQKKSAAWNPRLRTDTKYDGAGFSRPPDERAWRPNVQRLPATSEQARSAFAPSHVLASSEVPA